MRYMRSAKEYRMSAKERLAGNYGTVIGVYLIYTIIVSVLSIPTSIFSSFTSFFTSMDLTVLPIVISLVSIPVSLILSAVNVVLTVGLTKVTFDIVRGKRGDIITLFYGFSHNVMTVVCIYFWVILYILPAIGILAVGGGVSIVLLVIMDGTAFIIAGVVLFVISLIAYVGWIMVISYAISMTYFLYYDNPGMKAGELVKMSMRLMKGYKLRLFRLNLSYLGYYLLGVLSCGLAFLWISPNVTAATVLFYEDLISADDPDAKVRPFIPGDDGNGNGGSEVNENSPSDSGTGDDPYSKESGDTVYHQNYWN